MSKPDDEDSVLRDDQGNEVTYGDLLARRYQVLMVKPMWVIEDVAFYLSRTVNGVRTMRKLGNLPPACKAGKQLYWVPAEVQQWLLDNREADDYDPSLSPRGRTAL